VTPIYKNVDKAG